MKMPCYLMFFKILKYLICCLSVSTLSCLSNMKVPDMNTFEEGIENGSRGITYLGTACFLLDDGEHRVLLDPGDFFSNRLTISIARSLPSPDLVLVTHGDFDHCNRLDYIPGIRQVPIISTMSVKKRFPDYLVETSGLFETPWVRVEKINILHGVRHGTDHTGYRIDFAGKIIYFFGDGAILKQELPPGPDFLFVSLCGMETNVSAALKQIELLKPRSVVAMHWEVLFRENSRALKLQKAIAEKYPGVECILPPYFKRFIF